MKSHLFLFACFAALALPLRAADWPQWRGPKRDGVSTEKGLLKEWPEGGPKLVWKSGDIGRDGFSSVSVAGDRLYTMGDKDGAAWVFGLDRKTGEVLWSTKIGRAGGNYAGTRCTPTVDGDAVYALGQFGDLVCLDSARGDVRWQKDFRKDFGGQSGSWNYTESPLIDGDKLVCTPGGKKNTLVALNKKTGEVIWSSPLGDRAGYSSMVVSEAHGVRQYVQVTAAGVVSVSAADGQELWRYDRWNGNTANIPTPIVLGNQVFTAVGYGRGAALLDIVRRDGKFEAREVYHQGPLGNRHGGVVQVGDHIYGDTDHGGGVYCADWRSGKVLWKGRGRGSAAVTYADGRLYVRYDNGDVVLLEANPTAYREVGSFRIPNPRRGQAWSHPVVSGGRLYVREQDAVYCYDVTAR